MRVTYPPPFSVMTSVVVSRALDVAYQNVSGKFMQVYGTISSRSPEPGASATVVIHVGSANPPVPRVQQVGIYANTSGGSITGYFPFHFTIPPGYWYMLESSVALTGVLALIDCVEVV